MKYIKETLWDRLFNRLPATEANEAIRVLRQGGSYKDIDVFTLKEIEHQVGHHREQAKNAIIAYRQWKKGYQVRRFMAVFRDASWLYSEIRKARPCAVMPETWPASSWIHVGILQI